MALALRACSLHSRVCRELESGSPQNKKPLEKGLFDLVPVKRFELPTHALRMRCSTS